MHTMRKSYAENTDKVLTVLQRFCHKHQKTLENYMATGTILEEGTLAPTRISPRMIETQYSDNF